MPMIEMPPLHYTVFLQRQNQTATNPYFDCIIIFVALLATVSNL